MRVRIDDLDRASVVGLPGLVQVATAVSPVVGLPVVAVVSCVAQLDNVIAPVAPAATNSKVFMITRGPCATEGEPNQARSGAHVGSLAS